MRRAGVSRFGVLANAPPAFRPSEVWVAVLTRAQRLPRLGDVKNRILIGAFVLALLLLAGLGVVLKSSRRLMPAPGPA